MIRFNKIMVLMGSVIMGIGLATGAQLATGKINVILIQSDYQDAVNYHEKLKTDIAGLGKTQDELKEKLKDYEEKSSDTKSIMEELDNELKRNEKLLGYKEVRGSGYIITMSDGEPKVDETENSIDSWLRIIHNEDMLKILNELKQNGADAISINGERVTETSEIYCSWAFISINRKKLPAPFVIKAVGNHEKLEAYVESEFNQLRNMKNRGIRMELEKMPIIILEGSIEPITPRYLQEIEK
ncbi:DUF881 domain-containing protein [Proteiniclasticum sp.]|uniref:DUF881 domain-containing protein n=1 Tax=Proteiniclasticum sp. TaxID=2053595 RepID=UPI0028A07DBE|nr:DUF881 domain-containing protein [Proteiniclasticum sp.]